MTPEEKELEKLLESSDEPATKVKSDEPTENKGEDDTYETKTKEEWTRNPRTTDNRLTYTENEIEVIEEDL